MNLKIIELPNGNRELIPISEETNNKIIASVKLEVSDLLNYNEDRQKFINNLLKNENTRLGIK